MKDRIIRGYRLTRDDALALCAQWSPSSIYGLANDLRTQFLGRHLETCSIMNARCGACSEDCKWCAQSARYKTNVPVYKLVSQDEALEQALHAEKAGVRCFSLVTSGRTLSDKDVEKVASIYRHIRQYCSIGLCGSFGLLNRLQLQVLCESGMGRYHCNLETSPRYFSQLCTTHTIVDKYATLAAAQDVGLSICTGGIIGMGESMEQRIDLALAVRELNAQSIPINILQPIKGTPLGNTPPLTTEEILLTFAMFRIINPGAHIRFAAGRQFISHVVEFALTVGISAALVGDMLTTVGSGIEEDFILFKKLNYDL